MRVSEGEAARAHAAAGRTLLGRVLTASRTRSADAGVCVYSISTLSMNGTVLLMISVSGTKSPLSSRAWNDGRSLGVRACHVVSCCVSRWKRSCVAGCADHAVPHPRRSLYFQGVFYGIRSACATASTVFLAAPRTAFMSRRVAHALYAAPRMRFMSRTGFMSRRACA